MDTVRIEITEIEATTLDTLGASMLDNGLVGIALVLAGLCDKIDKARAEQQAVPPAEAFDESSESRTDADPYGRFAGQ